MLIDSRPQLFLLLSQIIDRSFSKVEPIPWLHAQYLKGRDRVYRWDLTDSYAVVTPLRKAASYEQRKTNLGNQNFRRRIIT